MLGLAAVVGLATGAVLAPSAWAADVITFDVLADWSDTSNPNGAWSYELRGTLASSQTTGATWGNGSFEGWSRVTTTERSPGEGDWTAGDVLGHSPATMGETIAIAWTSPAYGTVDITGGIWDGGTQEFRFNVWSLTKNDVTLTDGSIPSTNSDSYNSVTPFDFLTGSGGSSAITGIDLAEGDIVRLVVRTADNVGDHVVVKLVLSFLPRTGGAPPTVTADVASGTYGDVQTVSLTCQDDVGSCAIHYTTDGSTPTPQSTVYAGPLSIAQTTRLKFIAVDDFDILSAVVVEDYLIDLVSPQVIITDPPDLASVNQLFEVSGTAADPDGSGVANVRVRITDV